MAVVFVDMVIGGGRHWALELGESRNEEKGNENFTIREERWECERKN